VKEEVQVGEEEEEEEKEREDLTSINRPLLPYYSCKTQHILTTYCNVGRDSSVCTAARYGLGGPGSNPGGGEVFRTLQPPVQWVLDPLQG